MNNAFRVPQWQSQELNSDLPLPQVHGLNMLATLINTPRTSDTNLIE